MSNLSNYTNKSTIMETKLNNIDSQAIEMLNSGEYTKEEIGYFIKTSIVKAMNNLGKPSMNTRPAFTVPVFKDYKDMVNETVHDFKAIITDTLKMYDINRETATDNEITRTMSKNKLNLIAKDIESVKKMLTVENIGDGFISFSETFGSTTNSGNSGSATVNLSLGALTLSIKNQNKVSNCLIEMLEGSNGYPGNTHQAIKSDGDILFEGESGTHADINDIIDGNNDTWFEYELFSVDERVTDIIGKENFEYNEGLSWIDDSGILNLVLKITLNNEANCNTVTVKPFLPNVRGGVAPVIHEISVASEDLSESQIVAGGSPLNTDRLFIFKEQPVKYVTIKIKQTSSYETYAGNFFYGNKDNNTGVVTRTGGTFPSVEVLGIKYSPKEKAFSLPKGYDEKFNKKTIDENKIKDELFGLHLKSVNCFKEVFPAQRHMIGLKEISLSGHEYDNTSTYTSKTITTDDKITSISLESDELIPSNFGLQGEWIKYYISLDEGKEWLQIYPRHRSHTGHSTYRINSLKIDAASAGNVKHIYRLTDSNKLKLKIELKRPAEMNTDTPIVYSYNLNIKTGDETLD